ncbi:MAG: hypothetical protein U0527_08880 [Candidatus Eisenbacteria bacterium]
MRADLRLLLRALIAVLGAIALAACGGSRPTLEATPGVTTATHDSTATGVEEPASVAELSRRLVRAHWRRAQALATRDSLTAADQEVAQALAIDSLDAPSLVLQSDLDYRAGRHDAAIARLEAARPHLVPCPIEVTAALALHLAARGEADRAESLLAPFYADTRSADWKRLGSVLTFAALRSSHPESRGPRAAEEALAALDSPINRNNQGIALLVRGDAEAARTQFLEAHAQDPTLPGPLYNLAIVERFYFQSEAKAREWFEQYLALSDQDPDGLKSVLGPSSAEK